MNFLVLARSCGKVVECRKRFALKFSVLRPLTGDSNPRLRAFFIPFVCFCRNCICIFFAIFAAFCSISFLYFSAVYAGSCS